jgi:hypothetical protein
MQCNFYLLMSACDTRNMENWRALSACRRTQHTRHILVYCWPWYLMTGAEGVRCMAGALCTFEQCLSSSRLQLTCLGEAEAPAGVARRQEQLQNLCGRREAEGKVCLQVCVMHCIVACVGSSLRTAVSWHAVSIGGSTGRLSPPYSECPDTADAAPMAAGSCLHRQKVAVLSCCFCLP